MAGPSFDIRRRVEGWRAAERREQVVREQEGPMAVDAALDAAFEIAALFPAATATIDATRAREVAQARATWRKLRTRFGCPPTHAKSR